MRYSTFTPALLVAATAAPALAYPLTIRAHQDLSLVERELLDTLAARNYYYDDSVYARAQSPFARRSGSSVSSSEKDRGRRSRAPSPSPHRSSDDEHRRSRSGAPSPSPHRHGSSTPQQAHSSGHSSSQRSSNHNGRRDLARRAVDELVARILSEMEVDELD